MNKNLAFTVFMTIGVLIALAINSYVVGRIWYLFNLKFNYLFYILLFFVTFSFILSTYLEKFSSSFILKTYYFLSTLWLGVMLILLSLLVVFEFINFIHPLPKLISGITILDFTFIITVFSMINASDVVVKEINIPLKLKKKVKLVHISDLHLGLLKQDIYLNKIVNKINKINPDFVVITGDLFDGGSKMSFDEVKSLNNLKAPTYFVIGNHETYEGLDKVMNLLSKTKMILLRDKLARIKGMQLIGMDYFDNKKMFNQKIKKMRFDIKKPSILLFHTPLKIDFLIEEGINLQLAGHTHGGQIFPFNLFVRLAYPYVSGLYNKNGFYEYVSPGTGTWGPYMRFGSKNEITLINLD